ncbi:MAG: cytochrome c3 family protein [Anaerosomatales bacterium]|nr:cytochrome c3 family protein [Anaerosomatales bacterium]
MAERDSYAGDFQPHEAPVEGDDDRRRRRWPIVVALLLLLLLLCSVLTIVTTYFGRGPEQVASVVRNLECLQCHSELIPELRASTVHDPFELMSCTVCHTPHAQEIETTVWAETSVNLRRTTTLLRWLPVSWLFSLIEGDTEVIDGIRSVIVSRDVTTEVGPAELVAPLEELCWTCHGGIGHQLGFDYGHLPFKEGRCVDCHDPHASEYRGLLAMSPRVLCVSCHPSLGPQMAREHRHAPVENFFCTDCHHPHASEWAGILLLRQRELCFSCHPSVAWLAGKAVQHHPFEYDSCTGCHEPHGSDFEQLLITAEPRVCYECHADIETDFERVSIHPVYSSMLDCSGCHDPHAADYEALLAAQNNEICYQCHAREIRASYDSSDHARLLCIRCHTPHGSDFKPILREANPDLCLRCHAWVESHSNQHPVRPTYYDVRSDEPLTCTSTCHGPHGTEFPMMVRFYGWPFDGRCLQCHSTVGIDF